MKPMHTLAGSPYRAQAGFQVLKALQQVQHERRIHAWPLTPVFTARKLLLPLWQLLLPLMQGICSGVAGRRPHFAAA